MVVVKTAREAVKVKVKVEGGEEAGALSLDESEAAREAVVVPEECLLLMRRCLDMSQADGTSDR